MHIKYSFSRRSSMDFELPSIANDAGVHKRNQTLGVDSAARTMQNFNPGRKTIMPDSTESSVKDAMASKSSRMDFEKLLTPVLVQKAQAQDKLLK